MLKLDFLSSFLMSTTMSPTLRSMRVSEALGSPSIWPSLPAAGSNLDWVNFLMLRVESSFKVVTVPEEKSRMSLAPLAVLTV